MVSDQEEGAASIPRDKKQSGASMEDSSRQRLPQSVGLQSHTKMAQSHETFPAPPPHPSAPTLETGETVSKQEEGVEETERHSEDSELTTTFPLYVSKLESALSSG